MISSDANQEDIDALPWAAYVCGHHPHSLYFTVEQIWDEYDLANSSAEPRSYDALDLDLNELDVAFDQLSRTDKCRTGALRAFQQAFLHLGRTCDLVANAPYDVRDRCNWPPGEYALELDRHGKRLLDPASDLFALRALGAGLGRLEYGLAASWLTKHDYQANLATISGAIEKLPGDDKKWIQKRVHAALKRMDRSHPLISGVENHKIIVDLDCDLRATLWDRRTPAPLLVLDQESVTWFGQRRRLLDEFSSSEAACLWVMAEQPGKPVKRQTIIKEGKLQTDELYLKCTVCRLKKRLKEMTQEDFKRGASATRDYLTKDFITGIRLPAEQFGPYKLNLPADRVVVRGPRPTWMKPTTDSSTRT
jgi:hypothetical protein